MDLIGTQTPQSRITEPAAAVHVLELAVPCLAKYRRPEPAALNVALLEEGLGIALPADYKLLAALYPPFVLDDFLHVRLPEPGIEHRWLRGTHSELELVQNWWEGDMSIGLRPHPAPGGLLPWAESNQGDVFLWTTTGAGPDEWPVTVASRNLAWWHYAGGAVQFLAELVTGTLEPWAIPRLRPEVII
ncbi:hypothetical protein QLQ12_34695 [Actinoplanes sp. NEAU-A12]|uniref:SMI1/KNR4 family protein n=1 Tax=Actinoplanes sandaracinus TaxID=3045177 RepID=A0ABT6WVW6_9ACTN|nr:hypothetical protein [Actinoplanes sandaracinus]MDI6103776.1 hypothetical protein [Actinoplanes sandaracinus]